MTLVVDASVMVAALIDHGTDGQWAEEQLLERSLVAPHLMPVEVANILRRAVLGRDLDDQAAALAHADLLRFPIQLFPYEPLAARVWELRHNLTAYDACYVALAEALKAPLATLDRRLTQATGPRCKFRLAGLVPTL